MSSRIAALPRATRLHVEVEVARRREARALAAAGEAACARLSPGPSSGTPALAASAEVARALAEASPLRARRDAARRAAAASLDQDRADWADAPSWLKVLILARGLLVRGVLAAQRRRIERALAPLLQAIGAHALASPASGASLPGPLATAVAEQRARAERAAAERARLLEPLGGRALPAPVHAAARALSRVGVGVAGELRARLLPRLPGLAGLGAGWWVAHAFTSSSWAGFAERLGLRQDGPWVVSRETYAWLEFWVPLLAAALCAYLGSQAWAALERRYGRPPGPAPADDRAGGPAPAP